MRKSAIACLSLCGMLAVGLGVRAIAHAASGDAGVNSTLQWDPVTTDVNGAIESGISYELAITGPASDLIARPTDPVITKVPVTGTSIGLGPIFVGQASGSLYKAWVRAKDSVGNFSAWSVPFDLKYDGVAPKPPANLRLSVTITVGG